MPVRFFRTGITVNLPCRLRDTWSQEIENIPEIVQRLMVIAGACGTSALVKGLNGILRFPSENGSKASRRPLPGEGTRQG